MPAAALMGWGAGAAAVSWQGGPDGLDRVLALAVMVPAGFLGGALPGRLAASRRAARAPSSGTARVSVEGEA